MRVSQIKMIADNMDKADPNEGEEIKKQGRTAISNWIKPRIEKCSCVIVLIGEKTAGRKWVNFEIEYAKKIKKPIFGIRIHNLKDPGKGKSKIGEDPFCNTIFGYDYLISLLRSTVPYIKRLPEVYDPPENDAVKYITDNIDVWIEKAIKNASLMYTYDDA